MDSENDSSSLSGIVIEKAFVNIKGKVQNKQELYLRCSIQDYYIKFCESKIEQKELVKYLNKSVRVKAIIKDGEWDVCDVDQPAQSRIGQYIVILELVNE